MKCHIQYNGVENLKSVIYNLLSIWKKLKKKCGNYKEKVFEQSNKKLFKIQKVMCDENFCITITKHFP